MAKTKVQQTELESQEPKRRGRPPKKEGEATQPYNRQVITVDDVGSLYLSPDGNVFKLGGYLVKMVPLDGVEEQSGPVEQFKDWVRLVPERKRKTRV